MKGKKKPPKELLKPKVASVFLEVSAKDGAPMSQRNRLRLRRMMTQFARAATPKD
jgi:hypothetical protein